MTGLCENNEGASRKRVVVTWFFELTLVESRINFCVDSLNECQVCLKKTTGQIERGQIYEGLGIGKKPYTCAQSL